MLWGHCWCLSHSASAEGCPSLLPAPLGSRPFQPPSQVTVGVFLRPHLVLPVLPRSSPLKDSCECIVAHPDNPG